MEKLMKRIMHFVVFIIFIVSVSKFDGWVYWGTLLLGVLFVLTLIHLYLFGKSDKVLFYFIGSFILIIILLVSFILH